MPPAATSFFGWGPPPGAPPGAPPPGAPPAGGGYPPGGGAPPGGGGFAPAPPPGGFAPAGPPGGAKPITGGPQTMAMYAATIDPRTGLPSGEKPPASTAAVVSLVCGILLCLGPVTGIPAIIAGAVGIKRARQDPAGSGGLGLSIAGLVLGVLNLAGSAIYLLLLLVSAL